MCSQLLYSFVQSKKTVTVDTGTNLNDTTNAFDIDVCVCLNMESITVLRNTCNLFPGSKYFIVYFTQHVHFSIITPHL